ncbi:hypothetical protein E1B28_011311 [Marasmius oreades]|uniref:Peptidase S9 prolyl oligopeptidase catalytic domain-containing protein n=1 Tax=Marasmius oreades TaxID=181124 RepID=A0A9P7RTT3_9AGAR|nr:uncharacterized protein E1B28_011311 [Marasmius oreades]KAG7089649.1 hypothetical protein E1B28_011311 [Marasmius oreades]
MHTRSVNVGGLPVNVYSTSSSFTKPVVICFLLHGRKSTTISLVPHIEEILRKCPQVEKELALVAFDHRNHGHRLVDAKANEGWHEDPAKSNPAHAIDMYTIQAGTARDITFLIDFLPAYLFPRSDVTIAEWGVAGISLGGHSTWISLAQEPRITFGIPIIGCPDFLTLMTERAKKFNISLEGSEYLPDSILGLIRKSDPVTTPSRRSDPSNPFLNKKILVLSGGNDTLVPWRTSEYFVNELEVGRKGYKEVYVHPEAGHEFTKEMEKKMIDFLGAKVLITTNY